LFIIVHDLHVEEVIIVEKTFDVLWAFTVVYSFLFHPFGMWKMHFSAWSTSITTLKVHTFHFSALIGLFRVTFCVRILF